jgi:hypothetical protein
MTKTNIFKRVSVLLATLMVVYALTATASAAVPAGGAAHIYKNNSTTEDSMADMALNGATYTATDNGDGTVTVNIPIKAIENYMGFDGNILAGSSASYNGTPVPLTLTGTPYYTTGTLTTILPVSAFAAASGPVKVDIHFEIGLYWQNAFTGNHFEVAEMEANADLYLDY